MSYKSLESILNYHLSDEENISGGTQNELEVRFNTKGKERITREQFETTIRMLKSYGYNCANENGESTLKIQNDFIDPRTGYTRMSNLRTEIHGIPAIQAYCKTNDIRKILEDYPSAVQFYTKSNAIVDGVAIKPVDVDAFAFRISYQTEHMLTANSGIVRSVVEQWYDSKKKFRYMNRIKFKKNGVPLNIDLSIVKQTPLRQEAYNITQSRLLESHESYEIEIELNNAVLMATREVAKIKVVEGMIRKSIIHVLSGIQKSKFPISTLEMSDVMKDYMQLLYGKNQKKVSSANFCGPSSFTLQLRNITLPKEGSSRTPNIRNNYTVTDKADGERKLLYINDKGRIYLININMHVEFTGAITKNNELFNSLLDGEHITHNKMKSYINLYAAFDAYYFRGESVRHLAFVSNSTVGDSTSKYRMNILINIIKEMDIHSDNITDKTAPIRITNKRFYNQQSKDATIFAACKTILDNVDDGLYEYETDGLIFTPMDLGVGANVAGEEKGKAVAPYKTTWEHSFKWKPPEFNTIDFLVSTQKNDAGEDIVSHSFTNGVDTTSANEITAYKTLVLRCGFDENKHGYINPCQDVVQGKNYNSHNLDNNESYKPAPFYPSNPYDNEAHLCNIMLRPDKNNTQQMMTEDGEIFYDNTIVEFKYDMERSKKQRWTPIRVRHDKTYEYKRGAKNYGNAYHVANSNWYSIHNPITLEMIKTGNAIPTEISDDTVYYDRKTSNTTTQAMRDFHNLVVKKELITRVATNQNTLIDLAVGKAGDLSKWANAQLSFVFGIDVMRDNIENKIDGACARYLNYLKHSTNSMNVLFTHGNSKNNIRSGEAFSNERDRRTSAAIFGQGTKNKEALGSAVFEQYGVGSSGFDITSCQFALHYFFENEESLHGFLRNVSECTKLDGYFVGTCYDGRNIFDALTGLNEGESKSIRENEQKVWEITKRYSHIKFPDDVESLGYGIDVYQESINKSFREYLVNFNYLVRMMENYGFVPLSLKEASAIGLPNGIGSFSEFFRRMESDIDRDKMLENKVGMAMKMSDHEKMISFYNKYFVFKKVRSINIDDVVVETTEHSDEVHLEEAVVEKKKNKVKKSVKKSSSSNKPRLIIINE